ncbi:hypothetical protein [Flagellimonas sp. GZD32]|uniref:hypothetical protein n=1 Tax=Flagellimonas cixiensis TaxID=3228750 RepID=UPI0035C936CC
MNSFKKDKIKRVEIDDLGRLHLKPEKQKFNLIYRLSQEIHWDDKYGTLYSPKPRDWSYLDWYKQIIEVIFADCNTELSLTNTTEWINIPSSLKNEILDFKL